MSDYATMARQRVGDTAGATDEEKGSAFFLQVDGILKRIHDAAKALASDTNFAGRKAAWFDTLAQTDIRDTLNAARWVRQNIGTYTDSTYLEALRTAQGTRMDKLRTYVEAEVPGRWVQSADYTDLILRNRDKDAARVRGVRETAKGMLAEDKAPKEVLKYMSDEASAFVKDVVAEYIQVAHLENSALAIVGTGSFGSGELYPYSDIDVQLMTATNGKGQLPPQVMEGIIHNIRMRIRLANMKESTDKWESTLGWDLDQLTREAYDPAAVFGRDANKAMANAKALHSTERGKGLPAELAANYASKGKGKGEDKGKAAAKEKMDLDLHMNAVGKQAQWTMKKPEELDPGARAFDFKFKFLTLPKVLLNVLAMYYGLTSLGSWDRVDELVKKQVFTPDTGTRFKQYLDLTAKVRIQYQLFYEKEGQDEISPSPGLEAHRDNYPKGYYVLTDQDRESLKTAQALQVPVLVEEVKKLRAKMYPG